VGRIGPWLPPIYVAIETGLFPTHLIDARFETVRKSSLFNEGEDRHGDCLWAVHPFVFTLDGGHVDKEKDVVRNTMDRIRAYFEKNPDAADTVEGVSCWLVDDHPVLGRESIQEALERLAEIGDVQKDKLPGGKILYRRRRSVSRLQ
jgi:hypothetical protein